MRREELVKWRLTIKAASLTPRRAVVDAASLEFLWRYWVFGPYETDGLRALHRVKRIYAVLVEPSLYRVLLLMFFSWVTPLGVCDPPAVRSSSASWITVTWWRLRCRHTNPDPPGLQTARGACWSACFSGTELWEKPASLSATQPMDIQRNTSRQRSTTSQVSLRIRKSALQRNFHRNNFTFPTVL